MFDNFRQDYARLADFRGRRSWTFLLDCLLFDNGFQACTLYRIARWWKAKRIPLIGPAVARINLLLTGVDINPNAIIGPGLVISQHGVGLVIGGDVRVGARALLHHGVTLGAPTPSRIVQMPRIGDGVSIGAGACIIGDIEIGDRCFIGATALVTQSVPAERRVLARSELIIEPRRGEVSEAEPAPESESA